MNYIGGISTQMMGLPLWTLSLVLLWSLTWKLLALWKSARNNSLVWFIILGLVNTMGILEILYIFVFSKIDYSKLQSAFNKRKTAEKKVVKKKRK